MIIVRKEELVQTPGKLYISIQIPSPSSVYCSPFYVSLNASPYFYEIDLVDRIDTERSKVVVQDGKVVLELVKQVEGVWESIKYQGGDIRKRREMSRKEEEERLKEVKDLEIRTKRENERSLVKKQMAVEEEMRRRVTQLKENETELARNAIMEFARVKEPKRRTDLGGMVSANDTDLEVPPNQVETKSITSKPTLQTILDSSEDSDSDLDLNSIRMRIKATLLKQTHCPPRQKTTTIIKVKFSDRGLIPTSTARESEDGTDNPNLVKWMTRIKLVKAMESHQTQDKSNTEGYKQKGNQLFRVNDYKSALNAYSQAIEGDGSDASLYANRAAVLLKLGSVDAEGDCTTGLEIINRERKILKELGKDDGREVVRSKMEVKLLMRRGACRAELMGNVREGLEDYEKALELDRGNETLAKDVEMLKSKFGC